VLPLLLLPFAQLRHHALHRAGDWRRDYLAALSASCEMALPFLVTLLKVRGVLTLPCV
jgi:hypothetical protein